MITYFNKIMRRQTLKKVSKLANIDTDKVEVLFSNMKLKSTVKVIKLDSKTDLIEALWEVTNLKAKNAYNSIYPSLYSSILVEAVYEGRVEMINVLKGRVKPGKIEVYDCVRQSDLAVWPVIEKEETTIFIKTLVYMNEYPFPSNSEQVIFVYSP